MEVTTGDILLAEPFMKDENFKRAVILLCEHNDKGSFGLVLNKKVDLKVNDVLPDFPMKNIDLYAGGPVGLDTLHFIHTYGELIEGSIPVREDVYWSGNFEQVKMLFETESVDPNRFRFFIGYSGWGAGQIDSEMESKSWIVSKEFNDVLLKDERLWKSILEYMGGDYKFVSTFPEDPQLN
ncbi:MAG: YqgE/AlgH family protein [Chitinophagales bacterium]